MTTMLKSFMRLHFLLLLLLWCVSPSVSGFINKNPVVGLVACRPHQIQAFTQFKKEFDTSRCNHSDYFNGVWCDNSTGAITNLQLRDCLTGTLMPNSSLFKDQFHHLRHLVLSENNFIYSSLPSEFGNLNRLEVLSLSSNGFSGHIPPTFSNLTQLTELYLYDNKLTGSITLVQNLTKLSHIKLSKNHFSGTIPSSIFTMPFLSYLDLSENNLNGSIEVPNSSISSSFDYLDLGFNNFEGKILEPISNLTNLEKLDLSFLNTSYPFNLNLLSSLKSLTYLSVSGNSISKASLSLDSHIPVTLKHFILEHCGIKEFPNILKSLGNLELIDLFMNEINGKIPEWLWSLPHLKSVIVVGNLFNGFEGSTKSSVNSSVIYLAVNDNCFKEELPHLPLSIKAFYARNNRFKGDIPLSICNRSSLALLDMSYNNLNGAIPKCLSNLTIVYLRKNNLQGSIPDTFFDGASLNELDVGFNRLTGKLPRSLLNCSSLKFLSLENNRIKDTFPFWLKALPNLQILILRSNQFYGPISSPHQGPLGFPELRIFEISNNKFTGSLAPSYFVNWKASSLMMNEGGGLYMEYHNRLYNAVGYTIMGYIDLQYKGLSMEHSRVLTSYATIDFSGNRLEGQIPESIGLLKALIALNLSNNGFTEHIPLSLANLTELESLDLSRNNLSGTIPNALGSLSFLEYINVSHNQLEGEIPQGTQITGQPKSSFEGNTRLCGLPFEENCFGNNVPPTLQPKEEGEEEEEEKEEVLNWKAVAIGYGPGILLGLAISQVIASYKPEWLTNIYGPDKRRNH